MIVFNSYMYNNYLWEYQLTHKIGISIVQFLILVQAKEERSKPRCDVALNPTTIKMAEAEAVVYANSVKHSGDEEYKQIKVGNKLCHCLSCRYMYMIL